MIDNWIEVTLRFLVDAQERRAVKGRLHQELLQFLNMKFRMLTPSISNRIVIRLN